MTRSNVIHLADVRSRRRAPKSRPTVAYAAQHHPDGTVDLHLDARAMDPAALRQLGYELLRIARAVDPGEDPK